MNIDEALALLGLSENASAEEIRVKSQEQYRLWSNRVTTAPAVASRQRAERQIEQLDKARQILAYLSLQRGSTLESRRPTVLRIKPIDQDGRRQWCNTCGPLVGGPWAACPDCGEPAIRESQVPWGR